MSEVADVIGPYLLARSRKSTNFALQVLYAYLFEIILLIFFCSSAAIIDLE